MARLQHENEVLRQQAAAAKAGRSMPAAVPLQGGGGLGLGDLDMGSGGGGNGRASRVGVLGLERPTTAINIRCGVQGWRRCAHG